MPTQKFTEEEWKSCIKVLTALKDCPLDNPDNETFKSLVAKIYKNARKTLRKDNWQQRKQEDINTLLASNIAQQALANTSSYSASSMQNMEYKHFQTSVNCYVCNEAFYSNAFFLWSLMS